MRHSLWTPRQEHPLLPVRVAVRNSLSGQERLWNKISACTRDSPPDQAWALLPEYAAAVFAVDIQAASGALYFLSRQRKKSRLQKNGTFGLRHGGNLTWRIFPLYTPAAEFHVVYTLFMVGSYLMGQSIRLLAMVSAFLFAGSVAAGSDDAPPTDAEATEALRAFVSSLRAEPSFPQGVAVVQACDRSPEVVGYLCSIDWHSGNGAWKRNRVVGFSKRKDGTWGISRW